MSNNLQSRVSDLLSTKAKYPTKGERIQLEKRVLSTVLNLSSYEKVKWLTALDFQDVGHRNLWKIIENAKGNFREVLREDIAIADLFACEVFHFNAQAIALLLVECNIHKAITDKLESMAYTCEDLNVSQFLLKTAQQALNQDALKLHAGILIYVKPMVNTSQVKDLEQLIERITVRIKSIKSQWI